MVVTTSSQIDPSIRLYFADAVAPPDFRAGSLMPPASVIRAQSSLARSIPIHPSSMIRPSVRPSVRIAIPDHLYIADAVFTSPMPSSFTSPMLYIADAVRATVSAPVSVSAAQANPPSGPY